MRNSLLSFSLLVSSLTAFAVANGKAPVVFPVTLTWAQGAPDGFEREMIFVNNQMPGPALYLEEGDDVEVRFLLPGSFRKADRSDFSSL